MIIEQIPIGPMANFGYILGCEETSVAALIDPAFEPEKLIARAKELELDIEWILITHGHFKHINVYLTICCNMQDLIVFNYYPL